MLPGPATSHARTTDAASPDYLSRTGHKHRHVGRGAVEALHLTLAFK